MGCWTSSSSSLIWMTWVRFWGVGVETQAIETYGRLTFVDASTIITDTCSTTCLIRGCL